MESRNDTGGGRSIKSKTRDMSILQFTPHNHKYTSEENIEPNKDYIGDKRITSENNIVSSVTTGLQAP